MALLTTGNPKIEKGLKKGFLPFILHLAPADLSGYETCPKRSAGCTAACLNTAGRGGMYKRGETTNAIQQARIRKTRMFFENREEFLAELIKEIRAGIKRATKLGLVPCFRFNGTSDIVWERVFVTDASGMKITLFEMFPDVQFYDYTAIVKRNVAKFKNYHLTFSRKESNAADTAEAIRRGMNVAVVFDNLPETWNGVPVFAGDETDLRFLDPTGVIVGLKAKGKAKKDTSGFVVYANAA